MNLSIDNLNVGNTSNHLRMNATLIGTDSHLQEYIALVIRLVTDVTASITNVLMLMVCYRHQKREQSAVGVLIMQLVCSWILNVGLAFPMGDIVRIFYLTGYDVRGPFCLIRMPMNVIAVIFGNCADACLGINRFVAICLPMHYRLFNTKTAVCLMTLCSMALCGAVVFLPLFRIGGVFVEFPNTECAYLAQSKLGAFLSLFSMILPNGIIGICCLLSAAKVLYWAFQRWRANRVGNEEPHSRQTGESNTMRRRVRVAQMLLVSFLFSVGCAIPFMVIAIGFPAVTVQYPNVIVWVNLLYRAPYSICPLIMIRMSNDYGRILKGILAQRSFARGGVMRASQWVREKLDLTDVAGHSKKRNSEQ